MYNPDGQWYKRMLNKNLEVVLLVLECEGVRWSPN
jgi:hypothetical protein